MNQLRIGVDVGGTNTDAVLMNGREVIATQKMPTTTNISDGVVSAIKSVFDQSNIGASDIACVMIGTTHFTNAFIESRGLLPVGIIRIAKPAARGIAPLSGWPGVFKSIVGGQVYEVEGGYNFDGGINSKLDEQEIARVARELKNNGIRTVAISGLFSSVNSNMEERARSIIANELPDASITLSNSIGKMGLLERENSAIMNASLADLATQVVDSFRIALKKLNIQAPFFISQNDGTLMSAERVQAYPVLTFASGPTNSMRGAAYLSGIKNAIVADIGGTTTDIGVLSSGFPRESAINADVGGVRTNFRMPDILAIGLGGGSLVKQGETGIDIGPTSVGYRLLEQARVFGGSQLTATDVAVAAGYADIGDPSLVEDLPKDVVRSAVDRVHTMLSDGVDRMKTSADPEPLVLVGGGAVLIDQEIKGVSEVIVPDNAGVANAIGASIAQVSGEIDKVFSYEGQQREEVLEDAITQAKEVALGAGAIANTLKVTEIEELPIPYMPGESVRVRVKVAGNLNLEQT